MKASYLVKMIIEEFDEIFYISENYIPLEKRETSCFFTGHRNIRPDKKIELITKMKNTVSYLYTIGVTDFHTGGALGFDTLAAAHILDIKREHPGMKLILDLPFVNQTQFWDAQNKRFYEFLFSKADVINYAYKENVSDKASASKYLLMRNRMMADSSLYCISYYCGRVRSGTGHTINYAKKTGCEIINLY